MATLVLRAAGAALGGLFGPVGAAIGGALGGLAGASIDQALLARSTSRSGPRLETLNVMSSTEGAPVPRVYGTMRVGGQVIWATALDEIVSTRKVGQKGARQTITDYAYRGNFAVGLCEGPVAAIRRVWADGQPLDLSTVVWRLHRGEEGQAPDPLIVAKEGAAQAPAYRGLAYVVFEGLPLEDYGNRLPQLSFEVMKPVGGLASMLRAVTLIPGAGEFVYEDRVVTSQPRPGVSEAVNRHMPGEGADFTAAIDELLAACPKLERVSLVVAWFGDDLRAGQCSIRPRAETASRLTVPSTWRVAGLAREVAAIVSTGPDGRPAYGGTPSDESVMRAIAGLTARGLKVTLYPFLMMDIPAGNGKPDPASGTASQPAYPWRGRITVDPATDGTAAAATQIAAFFGTASPAQFNVAGGQVVYTGPAEWSWRRFILHYARLAEAAGGVETFVIGSELPGLTRARSASGVYPAVDRLKILAVDVKSVLRAGTAVIYGADWTEYGAHVLAGGSEVRFPLDPLFAASAIDAVALDWYAPLADWRDGTGHLDAKAGWRGTERAYLDGNIAGGEGFDWFYASAADRLAQIRTPISDGAYGKPWVFRQKDLIGWWSNSHVERVNGVELPAPTAWLPRSKPVWFLETGCGAVDRGANQPSAFPDAKSSENTLPPFSRGGPDPLIQARVIETILTHWDPAMPGFVAAANPVSSDYGGRMVDPARIMIWAYDARPYPAFPNAGEVWADGASWTLGHWLNGRLGLPTLDNLVEAIAADHGVTVDASALDGAVCGAAIDRPMSARDAIEPMAALYGFEAVESAGTLAFRPRGSGPVTALSRDGLVLDERAGVLGHQRAQETELPRTLSASFADPDADYRNAVALSRRLDTLSRSEARIETGLAIPRGEAQSRLDCALQDSWIGRETVRFALPRSRLALEPGDLVSLTLDGGERLHMITRIEDRGSRQVEARRIEPAIFDHAVSVMLPSGYQPVAALPQAQALLLDLPLLPRGDSALQWLAATAKPWPGALNVWRSGDGASFTLVDTLRRPATMGRLLDPLPPGPPGRFDRAAVLRLALDGTGELASRSEGEVLDGANTLALRRPDGSFEVLQFTTATLEAADVFRLTGLLRGQLGTETPMATLPAGTLAVLVDAALLPVVTALDEIGRPLQWRVGPASVDAGDGAVTALTAAATTTMLRPYAPVLAAARRDATGITIRFIRRTRSGGDAWIPGEPPLGEEREAYEVDILAAGTVKRTLATSSPAAFYASADELADFGAPQSSLTLRIAQISALAGRGTALEVTLNV